MNADISINQIAAVKGDIHVFWSDQPNRLTGIVLIALAVSMVLWFIFGTIVSDVDLFKRDKIDDLLVDIEDNKWAVVVRLISGITGHAGFGVAAAAALYLLLRDRSRRYALFGFASILAAQAAFLIGDAGENTMVNLASDFAEGGPEGFDAGDPAILRDARSIGILLSSAQIVGFTSLSLGLIAFGVIIGWAPSGAVNPPAWLGWIGVIAGVGGILSWLIVTGEWAGIFFAINGLGTLIFLVVLGGWLLMRPEDAGTAQPAAA